MYTPGPWTEPRTYKDSKGRPTQAIIYGGAKPSPSGNGLRTVAVLDLVACYGEETEDNARLIAAAPELLEALEAAVQDFLSFHAIDYEDSDGNPNEDQWPAWVKQARAAIAKAKGD